MMPSVQDMIAAAQSALRELVVPKVEDQWAQSSLRSVDVILSHLHARTASEGPMLYADLRELDSLFGAVAALDLTGEVGTDGTGLSEGIAAFRGNVASLLGGYPPVQALAELNHTGRGLLDDLLNVFHAHASDTSVAVLHQQGRDYLQHRMERESSYFFPVFVGRPV